MKRRLRRPQEAADLDITAFMNLMIVLVPILLINMIIAHTSVLELNFPESSNPNDDLDKALQLQVIILEDQLVVSDNKGGVIKQISSRDKQYNFDLLGRVMQDIKARVPEKKDITIMAMHDTSYQTLVTVMDKVRAFQTVVAGSVVYAELFPEVSIADAPNVLGESDSIATKADMEQIKVKS